MFSIIIPTMWLPNAFLNTINQYVVSNLINEIIIIDNNPIIRPKLPESDKIKLLTNGHNIYVNPAWNWGVLESKNNKIILLNDDLYISDIDQVLNEILKHDFDLIGLNLSMLNKGFGVKITKKTDYMQHGFGCFMYLKKDKYKNIPEDLKVWYGDRILFESIKNVGEISFDDCIIELSKTVKSSKDIQDVIITDKINYLKHKKK
jgi:hypothetical protein